MTRPLSCLSLNVYSAVPDERAVNLEAKTAAASAADAAAASAAASAADAAPASLPPSVPLTAESVSVGSAHGWHKRTGR